MSINFESKNHQEVYTFIQKQLDQFGNCQTKTIRNLSKTAFSMLENKTIAHVLVFCEILLEQRKWAYGIIAYDFAYRMKHQYTISTFDTFEKWLFTYVTGWSDCDDFCTHAFGELLSQYNHLFARVQKWTNHQKFTVRRASAVILIHPIKYNHLSHINPFIISDRLMQDAHDLVQKGYGWMLKVLSQKDSDLVYHYLKQNYIQMPRTAYRYALEKFDVSIKKELMNL